MGRVCTRNAGYLGEGGLKFEILTEPKTVVFVRRANHYLNTAQSLRWVFYDRKIVDGLVNKLE